MEIGLVVAAVLLALFAICVVVVVWQLWHDIKELRRRYRESSSYDDDRK